MFQKILIFMLCLISFFGCTKKEEDILIDMQEVYACEQESDCIMVETEPYGCGNNTLLPINKNFLNNLQEINSILPMFDSELCAHVKVQIITKDHIATCYRNTCQATYK